MSGYGLIIRNASGQITFDSRHWNLLHMLDYTITIGDVGTTLSTPSIYKVVIFIEPVGTIGQTFTIGDLYGLNGGTTSLATVSKLTISYSGGNVHVYVHPPGVTGWEPYFRSCRIRVFHYGELV
jgi:hypothetical protein